MSIITFIKNRATQASATAGGLLMSAAVMAEDVDPAAAVVAKVEAAGVSAGAVGVAVLLVLVGIASYKLIKRAL